MTDPPVPHAGASPEARPPIEIKDRLCPTCGHGKETCGASIYEYTEYADPAAPSIAELERAPVSARVPLSPEPRDDALLDALETAAANYSRDWHDAHAGRGRWENAEKSQEQRQQARAAIADHIESLRTALASARAALDAKDAELTAARPYETEICGWAPGTRLGCGRPILTCKEVYRCTDCEVPFHRNCAIKHFGREAGSLASARAERDKFKQLYEMHYDGMASLAEDIRRKDDALASARAALDAKDAENEQLRKEVEGWQRVLPGYVDRISELTAALDEAKRREEAMRAAINAACAIIELGDQRLMAGDGPCGNQPPDLSLDEWRDLYAGLDAARSAVSRDTPGKWLDGSAVRDVVENVNAYDRLDPASRAVSRGEADNG